MQEIMKESFKFVAEDCYMVNRENNSLEYFEPVSFKLDIPTGTLLYIAKLGGKLTKIDIPQEDNPGMFFKSHEDFLMGNEISLDVRPLQCIISNLFFGSYCNYSDNVVWTNNGIEAIPVSMKTLVLSGDIVKTESGRYIPRNISCENVKTEIFPTEEAAKNFGEYDIVERDGTTKHIVGAGKKIRLTEKQNAAVEEFLNAVRKLNDENVKLVFDRGYSSMYAINGSKIDTLYSFETNEERAVVLDPYMNKVLDVDMYDYSECLLATFKD